MWLVSVLSLLWLTQVFASISTLITLLTVPDSGGGGINSNRTNSFVFLSLYLIIYFLYLFYFISSSANVTYPNATNTNCNIEDRFKKSLLNNTKYCIANGVIKLEIEINYFLYLHSLHKQCIHCHIYLYS